MKRISYLETQLNYLEAHADDLERKVQRLACLLEQRKKKGAAAGKATPQRAVGGPREERPAATA